METKEFTYSCVTLFTDSEKSGVVNFYNCDMECVFRESEKEFVKIYMIGEPINLKNIIESGFSFVWCNFCNGYKIEVPVEYVFGADSNINNK